MTNTQPAQASDEPMREAFETWCGLEDSPAFVADLERYGEGYVRVSTNSAWEAWKAATPQPPVIPAAMAVDDAKDAARYRWLLENYAFGDGYQDIDAALNNGEADTQLTPAILAAISAQQGPEGKQ